MIKKIISYLLVGLMLFVGVQEAFAVSRYRTVSRSRARYSRVAKPKTIKKVVKSPSVTTPSK